MDSVQLGLIKVTVYCYQNQTALTKSSQPFILGVLKSCLITINFVRTFFFLNAVFFSNIHLSPALEKMLSLLLMDHEQPLMANEFADKN